MNVTGSLQCRYRLSVTGFVQGVGFRPFVYRLATELKLSGGVSNTYQGVVIEIEGDQESLEQFLRRLRQDLPPHASIHSLEQQALPTEGLGQFKILSSQASQNQANQAPTSAQILPDLATCPDCLQDILNARNRRYHYPFTNCTHCGPRYSIVTALPYDRRNTTMQSFSMCPECKAEYADPTQRRFHAQPNACPQCGPALSFWISEKMSEKQQNGSPLQSAVLAIQRGEIVAIKGLGGFQLLVDAQNSAAVEHLRQRKGRPDKPFALMYPALEDVRRHCEVSEGAATLLNSAQAPIVLLPRRSDVDASVTALPKEIAPNNPYLGVMLPTTPLHHLLLQQLGAPVIATSGNLSGEPIYTDEKVACERLAEIADTFLLHNRPIQRPVDDAVVKLVQDQPQILRHARGYAPHRIQVPEQASASRCILALGAHLKSAIALSIGEEIVLSQHLGDLDTPQSRNQLQQTINDFLSLHSVQPTAIACDRHPDYSSTQLAQTLAHQWHLPVIAIQHHYAHILSCMAEHQLQAPILGIAWDGTGYGCDQTIWGGEFLQVSKQATGHGFERVAHFLPYCLPGGESCSLEPRRSALGLLHACYGEAAFEMRDLPPVQTFTPPQLAVMRKMLTNKINTPLTSSMGRLFDGVAALLNLHQSVSFEGQAALALEFAATQSSVRCAYPFALSGTRPILIDWRPMVRAVVEDYQRAIAIPAITAKFHNTLVDIIVAVAKRSCAPQVVMAGGCFQNTVLIEQAISRLSAERVTPYWPQRVPPNDGGLAVGQVLAAWRYLACVDL